MPFVIHPSCLHPATWPQEYWAGWPIWVGRPQDPPAQLPPILLASYPGLQPLLGRQPPLGLQPLTPGSSLQKAKGLLPPPAESGQSPLAPGSALSREL